MVADVSHGADGSGNRWSSPGCWRSCRSRRARRTTAVDGLGDAGTRPDAVRRRPAGPRQRHRRRPGGRGHDRGLVPGGRPRGAAWLRRDASPTSRCEGQGLDGRTGRNVLGWSPGRGALADDLVVIGAHYDHLGPARAADGATVTGIYRGAEDNASGVAVMVELARRLHARRRRPPTAARCSSSPSRARRRGCRAPRRRCAPRRWRTAACGLDAEPGLGRAAARRPALRRRPGLVAAPAPARGGRQPRVTDLVLELSDGGWDASDHVAFNAAGIPVLFLFTGAHPAVPHGRGPLGTRRTRRPGPGRRLRRRPRGGRRRRSGGFPYAPQTALPPAAGERGKTRAWLGTIPDFVENAGGVKLSGVMPGSPGRRGGAASGRRAGRDGGERGGGPGGLTALLQAHGAGETVAVTVVRDGERRDFAVTLRERPR